MNRLRRSARIFLFDRATTDLLLIRFVAQRPDGPYTCWVTPGGEVEPNEPDHTAAARELHEELGITPPLLGPVHEETGGTYIHLGETVHNYDVFFAAECSREDPHLTGITATEIALMREARWFPLDELATIPEPVFPPNITALAKQALRHLHHTHRP